MKTMLLVKTAIFSSGFFSRAYLSELKKQDQLWVIPIAAAGIITGIAGFLYMLTGNYRMLLTAFTGAGSPESLLLVSSMMSSALIFFVGTPLLLSNLFYNRYNSLQLSLPFSLREILYSRLVIFYLFTLPVHLAINIPAAVMYLGSAAAIPACSNLHCIVPVVNLLFLGQLPASVLALAAATLLGSAGILSGRRTAAEFIGMAAAILFLGTVQLIFSRQLFTGSPAAGPAETLTAVLPLLRRLFFHSAWTAAGFKAGGFIPTAAAAAVSAAAALAAAEVLKHIISPDMLCRQSERTTGGWKSRIRPYRRKSAVSALVGREWMVVRSSSSFLMESLAEAGVFPILLAVFYFTIPRDIGESLLDGFRGSAVVPAAAFGVMSFFSMITAVSSTSISREGKSFAISKMLPVTGGIQTRAKLIFHLSLFLPSWYINLVLLYLFLDFSPVHLLYLVPAGPAIVILSFIMQFNIDLSRPVLNWSHPQQAMKQNMNVPAGMGTGILIIAVLGGIYGGMVIAGTPAAVPGAVTVAAAAAADILLFPRLMKKADRRYAEISI